MYMHDLGWLILARPELFSAEHVLDFLEAAKVSKHGADALCFLTKARPEFTAWLFSELIEAATAAEKK